MSPSISKIWTYSRRTTLLFALICLGLTLAFWPRESRWAAAAGVAYGAVLGLAGLYFICSMVDSISPDPKNAKKHGAMHYLGRYIFYAVSLFAGALLGLPPLGMLAGLLCSKLALFIYSCKNRKDQNE